jgi:hypothetical protein
MADFHLTVKVRNGRLVKRMRELGIKNAAELARMTGMNISTVAGYLTFKLSPIRDGGKNKSNIIDWNSGAMRISAALRIEPEFLWPEHLARLKAKRLEVELFTDDPRLIAIDHYVDRVAFAKLLEPLRPREREVIMRRFGLDGEPPETLNEIAQRFGRSSQLIRLLEQKGLKRLKTPARKLLAHDVLSE